MCKPAYCSARSDAVLVVNMSLYTGCNSVYNCIHKCTIASISRNGNKMCALSNTSVLRSFKEQNIIRGRDILRCIMYALMVKKNECLTTTPSLWRHSTKQVKCFCLQILESYVKLKQTQMLVCLLP